MRYLLPMMVAVALSCASLSSAEDPPRPNIVYIFADDMGWGTGQFNNPTSPVETPNLNQLAAAGVNFTRHYSATVCSPSRAMLMTGFHTGNTSNDRNGNIGQGLRDTEVTVAEVLGGAGYKSSVFGKWGWGGSGGSTVLRPNPTVNRADTLPQNQGFDEFYGYLNHGRAHSYQVDSLWTNVEPADDNNNGLDEPGEKYQPNQDNGLWLEKTGNNQANTAAAYTHDLIGLKSEQYVRDNAGGAEPFYMQVNYTIPHFDLEAIVNTTPLLDLDGNVIHSGGLAQYAGEATMSDKEQKHAAMISRMDASIGSLMSRLADPNGDGDTADSVLDNTLVLFSSDNGPTPEDGLGQSGLLNLDLAGGLRGGKRDLFEGGIRSPLIARWDGQIAPERRGTTDTTPTDLADFLATSAELAGTTTPVGIDGVSIAPLLTGQGATRPGKVILSENFENSTTGNRRSDWTLIRGDQKLIKFRDGGFGLYDLAADPSESNPLDLATPINLALKDELEAVALAEGAGRGDNYFADYSDWTGGAETTDFSASGNWSLGTTPQPAWSTTVNNTSGVAEVLAVNESTSVLGLEVRGDNGQRTLDIAPGRTLTARNEVRVGPGGRIEVAEGTLSTARWIEVSPGGQLSGQGLVEGVVYNRGVLAPGRAANLPDPNTEGEPLGEIAPRDLDTGLVTLVDFDFDGIQDDAPLTQTTTLDENVVLAEGFNYGLATGPRNAADAGDEFNVSGFSTGGTLDSAIAGGNYLTFTLDTAEGAGVLLDTIRFDLWRNGVNAAESYAILTSVDGFSSSTAVATATYPSGESGIGNTRSLVGTLSNPEVSDGPVEVRLYGWNANQSAGNTHFNFVSATGRVIAIPTWALDFTGVQDGAPLLAIAAGSSDELSLVAGLDLGAGVQPKDDATNAGDEFNVSGWSTGSTLATAIADEDFLTFTVQSTPGLAMVLDSVEFNVWRHGVNAPTDFAVMSSLDGFTPGAEAGALSIGDFGSENQHRVVGVFDSSEATQEPIEFRLYGWKANQPAGNTHVNGVSLRARFQTVIDVTLDPTGYLAIDGDLHHGAGGLIALEIGGTDNTDLSDPQHDQLAVSGSVSLAGDLQLILVDGFTPSRGQAFELLAASDVTGEFSGLAGAGVTEELEFRLVYESDRVLAVVTTVLDGDFNADGTVDAADYTVWREMDGQTVTAFTGADGDGNGVVDAADYNLWAGNYGATIGESPSRSVPEATAATLVVASLIAGWSVRSARRQKQGDRSQSL